MRPIESSKWLRCVTSIYSKMGNGVSAAEDVWGYPAKPGEYIIRREWNFEKLQDVAVAEVAYFAKNTEVPNSVVVQGIPSEGGYCVRVLLPVRGEDDLSGVTTVTIGG